MKTMESEITWLKASVWVLAVAVLFLAIASIGNSCKMDRILTEQK